MLADQLSDVLIVGDGPAAWATAAHLLREGKCSVVVLGEQLTKTRIGEVLPPAISTEIAYLGLGEKFVKQWAVQSGGVSVWWGSQQRRDWDYIYSPYGPGWHIDRMRFDDLLREEAVSLGGVHHVVKRIEVSALRSDNTWTLTAQCIDGSYRTYETKVLVNASGRSRRLAHAMGKKIKFDKMVGCFTYMKCIEGRASWESRLWVEATSSGWFYSAPLPEGRAIVVFLTDGDLIENASSAFNANLANAPNTLSRVSNSEYASAIKVLPADSSITAWIRHPGAITVGDASFTTDPVRGHGVLQALRQSRYASHAIVRYLDGDNVAFELYRKQLKYDFQLYLAGLSKFYCMETRWSESEFWKRRSRETNYE